MSLSELNKAIIQVMGAVNGVQKTGRNTAQNYSYASEADFLRMVRPAMIDAGLTLLPVQVVRTDTELERYEKNGRQAGGGTRCDVVVTYQLTHTSGAFIAVQAAGAGQDALDKAPYKALTGALKYALRQSFLCPTGDDPEIENDAEREPAPSKATAKAAENAEASDAAGAAALMLKLGQAGVTLTLQQVEQICTSRGRPTPDRMDEAARTKLYQYLVQNHAKPVAAK